MKKETGSILKNALIIGGAAAVFLVVSFLVIFFTSKNGIYPSGKEALFHLYRADLLWHEMGAGNFYPLLDRLWYNGLEMMRYQAPLPVYLLAFCELLGGGTIEGAYLWAVGLIAFCCGAEGLILGYSARRPLIGSMLGLLWFFLPVNLHILFAEGNLPGAFGLLITPLLLHGFLAYMQESKLKNLLEIFLAFLALLLTDMSLAGVSALGLILFLILDILLNRHFRRAVHGLLAMLLALVVTGLWSYPAFRGGYFSAGVRASLPESLFTLFNPLHRLFTGNALYFGLVCLLLGLFGLFLSHRKEISCFGSGLLLLLLHSLSLLPVSGFRSGDPSRETAWLLSLALLLILAGFLRWRSLKWPFVLAFSLLLFLDALPSAGMLFGNGQASSMQERFAHVEQETLIARAKEITKQRLLLMDGGELGSMGAFLISGFGERLQTSGGADLSSAETASNLAQLEEALDSGCFPYFFDRALELGNDSIILNTSAVQLNTGHWDEVDRAAWSVGYALTDYNEDYRLYHKETPARFGLITEYSAIGIGRYTKSFSLFFPAMEETLSDNLDDYTEEELSRYSFIYLSGFTYTNRERAEDMLRNLARKGTRVVICGDGLPADPHTGVQSFMGVSASPIYFRNGYPELITLDGVLNPDYFAPGFEEWQTCYLNGLTEVWGSIEEQGQTLDFYGTAGEENIVFIGLNLTYHYALTGDKAVGGLISHAYTITPGKLPQRRLVPLEISYESGRILIRSDEDQVNTTLAWHDDFRNTSGVYTKNNLLYVRDGESSIGISYPYFWPGLFISLLGLFVTVAFFLLVCYLKRGVVIPEVEVLEVLYPAAGERIRESAKLPPNCGYVLKKEYWRDEKGSKARMGSCFGEGVYSVTLVVKAKGLRRFTTFTTGKINGKEAGIGFAYDHEKLISLEKAFTAILPLKFLRQPKSISAHAGTQIKELWELSRPVKVGYLETLDAGRWVVCDMLPEQEETVFSYVFRSYVVSEHRYRLTFLSDTEESITSEEFVISFIADMALDRFSDEEDTGNTTLPPWLAPADFFPEKEGDAGSDQHLNR